MKMMKRKWLLLLILMMVASPVVFGRQPAEKDRCSDWFGPYEDVVFYRYCQTYLGENHWSPDYDCYQFKNESSSPVEITWYTKKDDQKYGPYMRKVDGNTVDELIALSPRERLSLVIVKRN